MKLSKVLIPTLKQMPSEPRIASLRLLLKAGLIRGNEHGTYCYLPLGIRALRKLTDVINHEMAKNSVLEILLPATQMEESVTQLVGREIRSYKQLPKIFYQIKSNMQDGFNVKDEAAQFPDVLVMEAFSFNAEKTDLDQTYRNIHTIFTAVFSRCGVDYKCIEPEGNLVGTNISHTYLVPCESGDQSIAICDTCTYSAAIEWAKKGTRTIQNKEPLKPLEEIDTPALTRVDQLCAFLHTQPSKIIKTIIYLVDNKDHIAVLVQGDRTVNEAKLKALYKGKSLTIADEQRVESLTKAPIGFTGPLGLPSNVEIVADSSIPAIRNAVSGANKPDKHVQNLNYGRDYKPKRVEDITTVQAGDACPKCDGSLRITQAIAVADTHKVGIKHSFTLRVMFADERGNPKPLLMGHYTMYLDRLLTASVLQNADEHGIVWPLQLAPYSVVVIPISSKDTDQMHLSDAIYHNLWAEDIDALLDDRDLKAGVKFKDADLIGFPFKVVVGEATVNTKKVEIELRKDRKKLTVEMQDAAQRIKNLVQDKQNASIG